MKRKLSSVISLVLVFFLAAVLVGCSDNDDDPINAGLRLIHLSPDAPAVNVVLDESIRIQNTAYTESSGYISIRPGTKTYTITPTGQPETSVLEVTENLAEGTDHTLFAVGPLASLDTVFSNDDLNPDPDMAKVRFIHAVPDAPAVDIRLDTASGPSVFENREFGTITDFTSVMPGSYTFVVTLAGTFDQVIAFQPVALAAGEVYTVAAIGTLDENDTAPFGGRAFSDRDGGDTPIDLTPQPPAGSARVRVLHTSYDAPAVDVLVDGTAAIQNLSYPSASAYQTVTSGERFVEVTPAGQPDTAVISAALPLDDGGTYTILAVNELSMISALPLTDDPAPAAGQAKVRFVHAAPDAPAVDVKLETGDGPTVFGNQAFEDASDYTAVAPGNYEFVVTPAGATDVVVGFAPVALEAGQVYTVVAHGTLSDADAYPFAVRAFVDNEPGNQFVDLTPTTEASLRVIHASYDAPAVDVAVDGPVAIGSLAYPDGSDYQMVSAGTRNVMVTPAGQLSPVVISADIPLSDGMSYTVFAADQLSQIQPIFVMDDRTPDADQARVRFAHLSPDAPAVDIRLDTGDGPVVFGNAAFTNVTEYAAVDGGSYNFVVTAAGQTDPVVRFAPVTLENGSVYTVMAHGTLDAADDVPFAIRAFVDSGTGSAAVDLTAIGDPELRIIHLSYDAPDVDVWVDGETFQTAIGYGDASPFGPLAAGTRNVQVTETGTPAPAVIEANLDFESNRRYTLIAAHEIGQIRGTLLEDPPDPPDDQASLRVFHGAPDAPAINIRLDDGQGALLFENVTFDTPIDPITVAPGDYRIALTQTGSPDELFYFDLTLEGGTAYTAAANGTLAADDPYPFGIRVYVDTGAGDPFVTPDPIEAELKAIHASPDAPAVDLAVDSVLQATGLEYLQNTGYLDVAAGLRQVTVLAGDTPVIDTPLNLPPEGNVSVFAIDEAANLTPLVLADDLTPPAAGNAHVRFVHLSPGAPNVDITLPDGTVIFGDVAFGESDADGAFTPLAAGIYDLEVRTAGIDTVLLEISDIALSDGEISTVFARGFPAGTGDQALGATVIPHN